MKRIVVLATILFATNLWAAESMKKVFINQLVEHPALNMTTKGIMDGLEKNGYKKGVNLDIRLESAQANPALVAQIAAKFVGQGADVVVGVATISLNP